MIVIDDDEALRGAIIDLIRSLGYAGLGYESATAFCATDQHLQCACIITDIEMPGMDGFTFLHYSARQYPGVPVIMITALVAGDLHKRATAAGVMALLQKPFNAEVLAKYVIQAVKLA